jgi:hypothetical protein
MKSFKEFLGEKWQEFTINYAGDIDDPSFHPSQVKDSTEKVDAMMKRLNDIFWNRKKKNDESKDNS